MITFLKKTFSIFTTVVACVFITCITGFLISLVRWDLISQFISIILTKKFCDYCCISSLFFIFLFFYFLLNESIYTRKGEYILLAMCIFILLFFGLGEYSYRHF